MTPHAFDILRLVLVVVAVLLRLILMPIYLQAYLNLAYDRLEDQKKEAGRITNVDLQKKVRSDETRCLHLASTQQESGIIFSVIEYVFVDEDRITLELVADCFDILLSVRSDPAVRGPDSDVLVFCSHV